MKKLFFQCVTAFLGIVSVGVIVPVYSFKGYGHVFNSHKQSRFITSKSYRKGSGLVKVQSPKLTGKCSKSYTKKSMYADFGKPSKINGQAKTKAISGYFKPSNGYKFVNPYSRSK